MERLGGLFGMLLIAGKYCSMVYSFVVAPLMTDGDF